MSFSLACGWDGEERDVADLKLDEHDEQEARHQPAFAVDDDERSHHAAAG